MITFVQMDFAFKQKQGSSVSSASTNKLGWLAELVSSYRGPDLAGGSTAKRYAAGAAVDEIAPPRRGPPLSAGDSHQQG